MNDKRTDVFGVGNAMVDILVYVDEDFIREHALDKGGMLLVDAEKQAALLRCLEQFQLQMQSGGSAANTVIAVVHSGGTGFYSGKVAGDVNGQFYRQDLLEAGVHFDVHPAPETASPTGTCLVLTTPDAERTMCTHLGVSTNLGPADIDARRLANCRYVYIEGYLWDVDGPRQASVAAMQAAGQSGVPVAFTFSDPYLVDRFAEDFAHVLDEYTDVLFCNAAEVRRFTQQDDLQDAIRMISRRVKLAFITDGKNGCYVAESNEITHVAGYQVDAVDTVGAGDAFAGGVLYGLSHNYDAFDSARWGNFLASRVVTIHGARLPKSVGLQVPQILATP